MTTFEEQAAVAEAPVQGEEARPELPPFPAAASHAAIQAMPDLGGLLLLRRKDATGAASEVRLSCKDKAAQVVLSEDGCTASSSKGYRMVRATHGVASGAWYCEVRIQHFGVSGHARLGWSTCAADVNAPVGYDEHSVAYRSAAGDKVQCGVRSPYGAPFREGDVVGLYLFAGDAAEAEEVLCEGVEYRVERGALAPEEACEPETVRNAVAFAVNGMSQGIAFTNIPGDVLFPAASLFTEPQEAQPAAVVFNFGPNFDCAVPAFGSLPAPQPMSSLGTPLAAPEPAAEDNTV